MLTNHICFALHLPLKVDLTYTVCTVFRVRKTHFYGGKTSYCFFGKYPTFSFYFSVSRLFCILFSDVTWYTHSLTIYISIIHFLHSTHLRIFRWNYITYLSTPAVYITMVTWTGRSCILSGSSPKISRYTTNLKWKSTLLSVYIYWTTKLE